MSGQRSRQGTRTAGLKARVPLTRKTEMARGKPLSRTAWKRTPNPSPGVRPKTRRETGFSRSVKLAVRTRAGDGDPDQACCEACAVWLGRYGGQVQHIVARGSGGSKLRGDVANGCLLCGTPESGCHGLCEARDKDMRAMGFWRKSSDPPSPLMLHGKDGGVTVWLTADGQYSLSAPAGAA